MCFYFFTGSEMNEKTEEAIKAVGDISAASLAVVQIDMLPAVAALLTILWTITRLYESVTGRPFSESKLAKFLTNREYK